MGFDMDSTRGAGGNRVLVMTKRNRIAAIRQMYLSSARYPHGTPDKKIPAETLDLIRKDIRERIRRDRNRTLTWSLVTCGAVILLAVILVLLTAE